jgi:Skp family chaperone for outer membrane proteins
MKYILGGIFIICVSLGIGFWSQDRPKIGVIDIQRCFEKYVAVKDAEEAINSQREQAKKKLQELQKKIELLKEELKVLPKGSALALEKFQNLKKVQYEYELTRKIDESMLLEVYSQHYTRLYNEMVKEIAEMAKEDGFSLILRVDQAPMETQYQDPTAEIKTRNVLYASSALDITDLLIRRLNEKYSRRKEKR